MYPVVLIVAVLTSAAALWLGATLFGLDVRRLRIAVLGTLDCLWAVIVFFVVNVLLTIGFIAVARTLGGEGLSSYLATDLSLVIVSALQGVVFHLWRVSIRVGENGVAPPGTPRRSGGAARGSERLRRRGRPPNPRVT